MKFFAPRNDWNMATPNSWWGLAGGYNTASGVRINETTALTLSAVCAATRVISETLAALPCNMLEQVDARTTRKATNHPLWTLVHDEPNPEQDSMLFMDSQVPLQLNWGDCFAEKQYDSVGTIIAYWPIHASRIPLKNIRRNSRNLDDMDGVTDGQPGELVYYVNNDDGSVTPIPASDMFHVPGVLSRNGITGQSIIKLGATSLGTAMAAEQHAGIVFRNGAVTNMAIKSTKTVGKETADRLREQWQKVFAGVQNHYKTLILEDGMEPVPINMNPEDTQLLATRQFSVTEIARWYRLPPHLLADLSRSTFTNIESEGQSFITYSMLPWIVRWEKAMQRQLLTAKEKTRYRFKFNVAGLLRGDQAARGAFYQQLFNLGALSPNDIRGYEDLNPIDGGDQYFIQANNAFPLDKAAEKAQAEIDKLIAPPPAPIQPQQPPQNPLIPPDDETKAKHRELLKDLMAECIDSADRKAMAAVAVDLKDHVEALVQHEMDGLGTEIRKHASTTLSALESHLSVVDRLYEQSVVAISTAATKQDLTNEIAPLTFTIGLFEARQDEASIRTLAKAEDVRDMTREAILLAIRGEVEQLQRYEIRAARDAAKKPKEFPAWREGFYQAFRTKLTSAINVFVPAAEKIGFVIDADAIAGAYANESVGSLEPADLLPMSDFESGVEAAIEAWEERPERLVEGGLKA